MKGREYTLLAEARGHLLFRVDRPAREKGWGMRKSVLLLASMVLAICLASGVALALPSQTPDNTPMVDGRVRAIEQVGNYTWLGGRFTHMKQRNGTVIDNVGNVALLDSQTNTYQEIPAGPRGSGDRGMGHGEVRGNRSARQ